MKNFLLSLGFISFAFGATPSLDSLFKNLNNQDVSDKTVIGTYKITPQEAGAGSPRTIRFLFQEGDGNYSQICQVGYEEGVVESDKIDELKCFTRNGLMQKLTREQRSFYALLDVLLQNSSDQMIKNLKLGGSSVANNRELINKNWVYYLNQKKRYLQADKKDEFLESALHEKVGKDKSQLFLREDTYVKRVKNGRNFFYKAEDQFFKALFSHNKAELIKLSLFSEGEDYTFLLKNYISFNDDFFHPETIEVLKNNTPAYTLNLEKVFLINENKSGFNRRIDLYRKEMIKNAKPPVPPAIIY